MSNVWPATLAPRVAHLMTVALLATLLLSGGLSTHAPRSAAAQQGTAQVEWLGHLFYRLTSPQGAVILTSPWLENPDGPVALEELERTDIILVPNSHHPDFGGQDDLGNPIEVAAVSGATVAAPAPLGLWMIENGLAPGQFRRAGGGDRFALRGVQSTIGPSAHDNTLPSGAAGGPAASYFVTFENGFTGFFNGHSTLVSDLALYASIYKPDLAILGLTPPSLMEFAWTAQVMAKDNPKLKAIIPSHTRPGAPILEQTRRELDRLGLGQRLVLPELRTIYEF
jgi:L-ascorbate metabolism protein UlaG (beta-lactamase superfamily)